MSRLCCLRHHLCAFPRFRVATPQRLHLTTLCDNFPTSPAFSPNQLTVTKVTSFDNDSRIELSSSAQLPDIFEASQKTSSQPFHCQPHSPCWPLSSKRMAASPEKDHLSALPPELLHMIISYLFPTHWPDKAFYTAGLASEKGYCHDLDYLAATKRALRAEVMDWAESLLKQHKDITKYRPSKIKRKQRNWLRGRGGLISWSARSCVFCGKSSSRSAVIMNGLRCCRDCDDIQWPGKITKTDAKNEYHLTEHHLLPHQDRTPISAKMLAKHPGGAPKVRYGTCISVGVVTTLFLREEVKMLAKWVHGDLDAHLARREKQLEQRRKILSEKRAAKVEEGRRMAQTLPQFGMSLPVPRSIIGSSAIQPLVIDDDDEYDEEVHRSIIISRPSGA